MKPASLITTLFLWVITMAHLARLVFGLPVTVGGVEIPRWGSLLAALFTAILAVLLWREARAGKPAATATPR